jgi:hypothetical protein
VNAAPRPWSAIPHGGIASTHGVAKALEDSGINPPNPRLIPPATGRKSLAVGSEGWRVFVTHTGLKCFGTFDYDIQKIHPHEVSGS